MRRSAAFSEPQTSLEETQQTLRDASLAASADLVCVLAAIWRSLSSPGQMSRVTACQEFQHRGESFPLRWMLQVLK